MPRGKLYVHLVWSTRGREALIGSDWEQRLYACLGQIALENKARVLAVGGIVDHVHILVEYGFAVFLPTLIKQLKGASSHFVNHEICPGYPFAWQSDYYAASVSADDAPRVIEYIRQQKDHHSG